MLNDENVPMTALTHKHGHKYVYLCTHCTNKHH